MLVLCKISYDQYDATDRLSRSVTEWVMLSVETPGQLQQEVDREAAACQVKNAKLLKYLPASGKPVW